MIVSSQLFPASGSKCFRLATIADMTASALYAAPSGAPGRFKCNRRNLCVGSSLGPRGTMIGSVLHRYEITT